MKSGRQVIKKEFDQDSTKRSFQYARTGREVRIDFQGITTCSHLRKIQLIYLHGMIIDK